MAPMRVPFGHVNTPCSYAKLQFCSAACCAGPALSPDANGAPVSPSQVGNGQIQSVRAKEDRLPVNVR